MRLLFDQNAPKPLAGQLIGCEVSRAAELGWAELINGDLLAAAEAAGFDVLITADKNWRYQQNLTGRRIGIVVLPTNLWPHLREHVAEIAAAVARAYPGSYQEVDMPRGALVRRLPPDQSR